jgi:hypothetical protein
MQLQKQIVLNEADGVRYRVQILQWLIDLYTIVVLLHVYRRFGIGKVQQTGIFIQIFVLLITPSEYGHVFFVSVCEVEHRGHKTDGIAKHDVLQVQQIEENHIFVDFVYGELEQNSTRNVHRGKKVVLDGSVSLATFAQHFHQRFGPMLAIAEIEIFGIFVFEFQCQNCGIWGNFETE